MRIVLDMQGAQSESRYRGIGRYSLALAKGIVRNRGKHEIILVLNGMFAHTIEPLRAEFEDLLPTENIRVWNSLSPVMASDKDNAFRMAVAEKIREAFIAGLKPDVVHIMSFFEGYEDDAVTGIGSFDTVTPVVVTLYDLIPLLNPESYLQPKPLYKKFYLEKIETVKKAARLCAISDFARREGIEYLGMPEGSVVNISSAADRIYRPVHMTGDEAAAVREKFGITRPFVLYTGSVDERKNLRRLIRAYASLAEELRTGHQLVLTGRMDKEAVKPLKREASALGLSETDLIFTEFVSDDDLVKLYNLCKLFIFPSWHEGFGLPALEAMACGAAVIASNTTSLPEVVGRDDALFDPFDEKAIAGKLLQAITDEEFRLDLKKYGAEQFKRFSWDRSAKAAIEVYEELAASASRAKTVVDSHMTMSTMIKEIAGIVPRDLSENEIVELAHCLSRIPTGEDRRERKLFVDVSELIHRDDKTGIQRVTRSILTHILSSPPEGYTVVPVYSTIHFIGYKYAKDVFTGIVEDRMSDDDQIIEYEPGDVFLGLDLHHHSTRAQWPYLSTIRSEGVKVCFVVYDLLPIKFPQYWPAKHSVHLIHEEWLKVLTQMDGAVCISKAVADELVEWIRDRQIKRLRPYKVGWFHLGADIENSVPTTGLPENSGSILEKLRSETTFLMVGTIESRKGHALVLSAFERLWNEGTDVNLVVVGKQGWLVEELVKKIRRHREFGKRLFWLSGISDEYLAKVYAASTCLIAASEGEGFGLPLIEGAQHGLPIVARDLPVFREVAGNFAYYFRYDSSPEELAAAISEWMDLYEKGEHPKSEGMPYLTWKDSARQLMDVVLHDKWEYTIKLDPP